MRLLPVLLLCLAAHAGAGQEAPAQESPPGRIQFFQPDADAGEAVADTTVGMRVELKEFVIPGSAVQAKPVADPGRADALVRIKHEYTHGTGFRYDIEIMPFIEGELDLRDYLERKDGSSMDDVPAMPIQVEATLAADELLPSELEVPQPDSVGGYKRLLIAAAILWGLGLLAILLLGHGRRDDDQDESGDKVVTLADRLRPLVEDARKSELSNERRAELERVLMAHWRKRRGLESAPAAEAVMQLRRDDEAGPLFRQLEDWLHRPAGAAGDSEVDVDKLLAPYENVSADAELAGAHSA